MGETSRPSTYSVLMCTMFVMFSVSVTTAAVEERMRGVINWMNKRAEFKTALTEHQNKWRQQEQQTPSTSEKKFICLSSGPSSEEPESVHRLRAGDIDIVAAMGDSNTAANGAKAFTLAGCTNEYRGVSWSIGSDLSLDLGVTTLPNILKTFNPLLYGSSTGRGNVEGRKSRFNLAVPGSKAVDMPKQARKLVQKLKSDNFVTVEGGWKLITMLVGGNDLCQYCDDPDAHDAGCYVGHIREALDILHENVPRALVNVVSYFDLTQITDISETFVCDTIHVAVCNCAFSHTEELSRVARRYQQALSELIASGRYDTTDHFTVVYQPFLEDTTIPVKRNGDYDISYLAPDCFHFSQKGQELVATTLWNTMFEPVGGKRTEWRVGDTLQCPDEKYPYIATNKNSGRLARNTTEPDS